jgi:hypothetical protein
LSVYQPHFPQSTGTQPTPSGRAQSATGGRSQSAMSNRGNSTVVTSTATPTVPRVAPEAPTRTVGRTPTTQSSTAASFTRQADRPATGATAAPTPATGLASTSTRRTSEPAPRTAAPIILRGPDRPSQATAGSSAAAVNQAAQPNSLIIRGRRDGGQSQSASRPVATVTEAPLARSTAARTDAIARPAVTQRSQMFQTAEAQSVVQPRASTPHAAEVPVRTERAREVATTSYSAPVQVPRSSPAPAPAPQPTHSYSPPTPAFTPRAQVTESRPPAPAPSPSSSSAGSSGGGRSQSSSGRDRR